MNDVVLLRKALEANPDEDVVYLMLADALREAGDEVKANMVLCLLGNRRYYLAFTQSHQGLHCTVQMRDALAKFTSALDDLSRCVLHLGEKND